MPPDPASPGGNTTTLGPFGRQVLLSLGAEDLTGPSPTGIFSYNL